MKHLVEQVDRAQSWSSLPALAHQVIQMALTIQQIPAPTFHERQRALFVAQQFEASRLAQVEVDSLHNVYGVLLGKNRSASALLVSAHTDTVFSPETDLKAHVDGDRMYGPGLGDNSLGVAALLGLVHMLLRQPTAPECDIWFVANSREEGLGDLGGMKAVFERLKPRIGAVINLEGMALGYVYHAGIAVRRLHIVASAEGGHSWLNFGQASAVHGIVELGTQITALRPPTEPRTTYNIGMIEGGQSINTIASQASLWLDLRSEDSQTLTVLEDAVRVRVEEATRPDLKFSIEVVGDRPAGALAPQHPLVQGALTALHRVGIQGALETGSTDANVPLAAGYPAVTIGITRGGNAHRLDEYIETPPVASGLRQLVLLALATTTFLATS
jgi:acetylornithine deacetylase/succinyl-diaminopimelate desuccinylase-like protein